MVMREYVLLILAANVLAWGASWFLLRNWLAAFAYRIDMPWSSFLLASGGTALLALVTVGKEIGKVIRTNPVHSLRYE
jgi:putative ABC transport system permease protein